MLILVPTRCSIAQAICPYTSTCRLLHSWHSMETNERLVILTIILCSYFTYEKTEIQQVTCHRSHRRQGTDFVNQNLLTPNSCFITSVHAKSFQLCLTLCGPMDCRSSQCFSVHGILQASILECIAISPSKRSSQPRTNFSSVVCCSVPQSCLILWDCMDCSMPGLPVLHQLPELAQTRVHGVNDAVQPSRPLSYPSPPAFNLSQHQGLFQWVSSSHQMTKVSELQLRHQSSHFI